MCVINGLSSKKFGKSFFAAPLIACLLLSGLTIVQPKSRNVHKLILKNRKNETRPAVRSRVDCRRLRRGFVALRRTAWRQP